MNIIKHLLHTNVCYTRSHDILHWNLSIGQLGGGNSTEKKECEIPNASYQIMSHVTLVFFKKKNRNQLIHLFIIHLSSIYMC